MQSASFTVTTLTCAGAAPSSSQRTHSPFTAAVLAGCSCRHRPSAPGGAGASNRTSVVSSARGLPSTGLRVTRSGSGGGARRGRIPPRRWGWGARCAIRSGPSAPPRSRQSRDRDLPAACRARRKGSRAAEGRRADRSRARDPKASARAPARADARRHVPARPRRGVSAPWQRPVLTDRDRLLSCAPPRRKHHSEPRDAHRRPQGATG